MQYLDFWNRFLAAEQQGDVYQIKALGIELYPMLRTRLYYQLAQELGIFDNPHPNPEPREEVQPIKDLKSAVQSQRANVVIVPFVRRVNGEDPYSKPFADAMPRALTLDFDSDTAFDIQRLKLYGRDKYEDYVQEQFLKQKVRDQKPRWEQMVKAFKDQLGVSLGKFDEYPTWLIRRYIAECLGFRDFFQLLRTKKLYIVNAYSNPSLVVGAKLAGARVIEIQHGFISEFHPAYSYPNRRIQTAPNKLLVWGDFWAGDYLPKGCKPLVVGPAINYLEARDKVGTVSKRPKSILFSSQGAVGKELYQQALHWARSLPDYEITFRLHPNEDLFEYQKIEGARNLTLSHKTPSFLEVLGQHEYLVGGFSTTLYEGVSFGLKVLVLPLSGYENVKPAIKSKDMTLVSLNPDPQLLAEVLLEAKPASNPYSYYAKELKMKVALRA